jgi:hypothetical protein
MNTPRILSTTIACALCALLLACKPQETTRAVPYGAVNHTDVEIVSIAINGAGGVLNSRAHTDGSAGVCCVVVPRQWTPGLTATIQWEEDGDWLLDSNGKTVLRDGIKVYVPAPWKTRTVPIPRYDGDGDFYVFFFPGDDVRVAMTSSPEWKEWYQNTPEDQAHQDKLYGKRSQ